MSSIARFSVILSVSVFIIANSQAFCEPIIEEASKTQWFSLQSDRETEDSLTLTYSDSEINSTGSGAVFDMITPGFRIRPIVGQDGNHYVIPFVQGCMNTARDSGLPSLPCKTFILEVPHGVTVLAEILDDVNVSCGKGFSVLPIQPDDEECEDAVGSVPSAKERIVKDEGTYALETLYPASPVMIDDVGYLRERRVVQVRVYPVRYNPATGELVGSSYLRFQIKYEGTIDPEGEEKKLRHALPESESFAERLILNYVPVLQATAEPHESVPLLARSVEEPPEQPDYLIIAANNAVNQAAVQAMAAWKRDKGYRTWVRSATEIESNLNVANNDGILTWQEVDNYIDYVYANDLPHLYYVLIVGECLGESANIATQPWIIPTRRTVTGGKIIHSDLWYADVQDPVPPARPYPEFVVSRVSVDTVANLNNALYKILQYDREPIDGGDPDWYHNFLGVGYFEDINNDARADAFYDNDVTTITKFLSENLVSNGLIDQPWERTLLLGLPYDRGTHSRDTYHMIKCACQYTAQGHDLFAVCRSRINQFQWTLGEMDHPDVQDCTEDPGFSPCKPSIETLDWVWNGMMRSGIVPDQIEASLNEGRSLVIFRGHGNQRRWSLPGPYAIGDIDNQQNAGKLPVVLSICCDTGQFVEDAVRDIPPMCFCEKFLAHNHPSTVAYDGCVGIIGAAASTLGLSSILTAHGFLAALYGNRYDDDSGLVGDAVVLSRHLGEAHTWAKYYIWTEGEHTDTQKCTGWYAYNLFGEPEMLVRTVDPHVITATWDFLYEQDSYSVMFKVQNSDGLVEGARVAGSRADVEDCANCVQSRLTSSTGWSYLSGLSYDVPYDFVVSSTNATPLRRVLGHAGDYQAPFWMIDGNELARIYEFYSAGHYHIAGGSLDGYAPGVGSYSDYPHHSDYVNGVDGIIGLTEFTRMIQFYNADGYGINPGTEDGFEPIFQLRGPGMDSALVGSLGIDVNAMPVLTGKESGRVEVSVSVVNPEQLPVTALALVAKFPEGWVYESLGGGALPDISPLGGAQGTLEFVWYEIPTFPTAFTYDLRANTVLEQVLEHEIVFRTTAEEQRSAPSNTVLSLVDTGVVREGE